MRVAEGHGRDSARVSLKGSRVLEGTGVLLEVQSAVLS